VVGGLSPALTEVRLPDAASAWEAAGFSLQGHRLPIGPVVLSLAAGDPSEPPGWSFSDDLGTPSVDGIPTAVEPGSGHAGPVHPNGVAGLDHVVVATPDIARTIDALTSHGFDLRRTRATRVAGRGGTQAFFWAGEVILEVVGPEEPGEGPAAIWGIAVWCEDLDVTVAGLGPDRCGGVRDAVQPGRRVATLRTRELGISLPVLLMSPHVGGRGPI
jgi:hypothetical protein